MSEITKVGIIGSGLVGQALAKGFQELGYTVTIGSREGKKIENWQGLIGTFQQVAEKSDLLLLAVKGDAAIQVLKSIADLTKGKIIIDTTNPIDHQKPPVNGVLQYFTTTNESLAEMLQEAAPDAYLVKAFNSVGAAHMVHPKFSDTPTMFIAGNDDSAKNIVSEIISKLGWQVEDLGKVEAARAIEPLCILWCIPGFNKNDWSHAFKLVR